MARGSRRGQREAEALAALRLVLEKTQPDVEMLDQLARAQSGGGDKTADLGTWRRACDDFPESAQAWFNLARALSADAEVEDAASAFGRAVALAPDNRVARVMLGDALAQLGRIDAGVAQYREVLRTRPDTGHAWWGLANLKTVRFDASDLARMQTEMRRTDLPEHHRVVLGFALAKAFEDQDRYADAYAMLLDANRRMRRDVPWNGARFRSAVTGVREALAGPIAGATSAELGREVIFVVSLPRSGSTLVEQILSSHPLVEGTMELPDLPAIARRLAGRKLRGEASRYPEILAELSEGERLALGQEYLDATRIQRKTDRPFFIDKLPNNFAHAGLIHLILPNARIVDVRRHPLGCCFSCFKQHFARGQGFSYDLTELGRYYAEYVAMMRTIETHGLAFAFPTQTLNLPSALQGVVAGAPGPIGGSEATGTKK